VLIESNGDVSSVPTKARMVADVSGAGDTAIATLSAMLVAGATAKEAATIANFAAGVVCEHPGIVSIEPMDLFDSVVRNSGAF
jgi:bifunctional ADP-heptose synthase (sugar kinase/adenylyltransferase)